MEPITFNILNVIGTWVASIGTIGAVVTSLYLARRESKLNLRVGAGHRIIVGAGIKNPPDYCSIYIVNKGFRKAIITNIGWRIGFFNKRYAIQPIERTAHSSSLPIELQDGQEANYMIPFKDASGENHWIDQFANEFIGKHPKWLIKTLRIQVFTTVGRTFKARIEHNLAQKLIEFADKQR